MSGNVTQHQFKIFGNSRFICLWLVWGESQRDSLLEHFPKVCAIWVNFDCPRSIREVSLVYFVCNFGSWCPHLVPKGGQGPPRVRFWRFEIGERSPC